MIGRRQRRSRLLGRRFSKRRKSLQTTSGHFRLVKRPLALFLATLVAWSCLHSFVFIMRALSNITSRESTGQALRGPVKAKEVLPVDVPPGPPKVPLKKSHETPRLTPKIDQPQPKEPKTKMDGDGDGVPPVCVRSPLWEKRVDASEYQFGCPEVEEISRGVKKLIGNGNIRDVYLTEYKGQKLVIKILRDDFEERASKTRVDNIHQWEAAAINAVKGHSNIVGLLGMCGSTSVSQFFPERLDDLVLKPGADRLPIARVILMALDAARGLQALHEAPGGAIVHFDIKPQQLMLDKSGTLKINDLNMCWFTSLDSEGNSCLRQARASRPGPWRSPENISGEGLTEKLDVYSLAMVFYSMLAGKAPFEGEEHAQQKIMTGIPPEINPSWHPGFLEIMQDMWRRDPSQRPSARQVVERLEALNSGMGGHEEINAQPLLDQRF